jgi:hypothetical protein
MSESISRLVAELKSKANEAVVMEKVVERLLVEFPDLEVRYDRWNKQYFTSKSVMPIATDVMIRHSCGCCNDSPLYATPYVVRGDSKVFVDDITICVGERGFYGGDEPSPDLDEILVKNGFNEVCSGIVKSYLRANRPLKLVEDDE